MFEMMASRRLPLALAALLGVLLAVQAARLVLLLTQAPEIATPAPAAAPGADLAVLARYDPFFPDGATGGAQAAGDGGWTLFAVRSGGGGFDTAIIAGSDGRQALYRVGEALAPGVILDTVAPDHVLLSRGGARVRLEFPDAGPTPAPPPDGAAALPAPDTAPTPGATISPSRFSAEVAVTPRTRDGRVDGLTVQPRGGGASLQAAGLRAGDVILSVNGTPMNSAERMADLALELEAGASAEIAYERDGRRHVTTARITESQGRR